MTDSAGNPPRDGFPGPPLGGGRVSSPLGRGILLLLQLALTVAVSWFILRAVGLSLGEMRAIDLSAWRPRWGVLAASSLLLLLAYLYSAALWGLMVKELGGAEVGIVTAQRVFFTANLGRYLPGKLWQIAGLAYLAQREGVRPGTATAAALLGQGFSLAGATLVGVGVLLEGGWNPGLGGGWSLMALILLLGAMIFPAALRGIVGLWLRLGKGTMPGGFRPDAAFGIRWMGLYGLAWIGQGVAFWMLALGLGLEVDILGGAPAYPAAYVLGYLAVFAPAGVGVREATLVVFLEPLLGAEAAALAVAARLWTTVLELLLAGALGGGYLRGHENGEGAGA